MADPVSVAMESSVALSQPNKKRRDKYYQWTAFLLLALVVAGFAPTLYLRAFFDVAPIPAFLYLHGAVLTTWFGWVVLQTWLIRSGSVALHRKTGMVGAVIAIGVVIVSLVAIFAMVPRFLAQGVDWDTDMGTVPAVGIPGMKFIAFASIIVWGDLAAILVFTVLVTSAILLHSRPQVHKRLMLIACFNLIGPALARLAHLPALGGDGGPFLPIVTLALLVSLIVHDFIMLRRPHLATVVGIGLTLAVAAILQLLVGGSEFGRTFIQSLG